MGSLYSQHLPPGMEEEQCISNFVHGLETRSLVEFLFIDLPTTYKGLMEKTYTWIKAKEVATNEAPNEHKEGSDKFNKSFSWDNNKGRKKNQDKHETNQCRMLRHQIKETVKSGKLAHLVKGIKKGKVKAFNTQMGEWKKGDKDIVPAKALILMVSRGDYTTKRKSIEGSANGIGEITFPCFRVWKFLQLCQNQGPNI
ncbi:hypothetical protein Tco_1548178 [Tanacetum coccineum]